MVDPFTLDFAALRCLRMVHDLGSFSRAAQALGLGQSSVSYTIGRLRAVFGDPLFVRQGGGIVATQRCVEIVTKAGQMVDEFAALAAPRQFDPQTADLTIGISCNFYERVTILPELTRILRREAPGIRLKVVPSQVRGREQLKRGESDILIGPIRFEEAGYYRRSLFTDDFVCIMAPTHPLSETPLSLEDYVATPQIVVNYGGTFRSQFLVELEARGLTPNTVMEVPSPANLPDLLAGTDLIATVPRRTARVFGNVVAETECPVTAEISIDLQWTARTHVSAAHIWLRERIADAAGHMRKQNVLL